MTSGVAESEIFTFGVHEVKYIRSYTESNNTYIYIIQNFLKKNIYFNQFFYGYLKITLSLYRTGEKRECPSEKIKIKSRIIFIFEFCHF